MRAYTVGNPVVYDPLLLEGKPLRKAEGGVIFSSVEDALDTLENGKLPLKWFPEGLPGAVYSVELDGMLERVSVEDSYCGRGRRLIHPQRIVAKVSYED